MQLFHLSLAADTLPGGLLLYCVEQLLHLSSLSNGSFDGVTLAFCRWSSVNLQCSHRVHASWETNVCTLDFSAVIPVIEVVAAVLAAGLLPFHQTGVGLVLHHDALLERRVMVLATIAAVHRDLHGIKLILCVLSWLKLVVRDSNIVVPKRHFEII